MSRVLDAGRDQLLERSRKIVRAAYDLLEEEGLDGLTIRAVLGRSGLSRRVFYERFRGKDDLVMAVFEETIRLAANHYRAELDRFGDPVEGLRHFVYGLAFSKQCFGDPDQMNARDNRRGAAMSREHLRLAESRPHDLQQALQPLLGLIARQLAAGMAAGTVRRGDPDRMAALLYNLISTTVHKELLAQEKAPADSERQVALVEELWQFCWRAIRA